MKIKTQEFIHILSKAIKGAGNNKLIPITSMLGIEAEDGIIKLYTTDGNNYMLVKGRCDVEGNFSATVGIDKFTTLMSRLSCETVELNLMANGLEVKTKTNGRYLIELPLDENGEFVKFPIPQEVFGGTMGTFATSQVKLLIDAASQSLATTMETPCYTNYYIKQGERTIATDSYKITSVDMAWLNETVLLSPYAVNLLALSESDTIEYIVSDGSIQFITQDISVWTHAADGIEDFAVEPINGIINTDCPYSSTVDKKDLLSALNRAELFTDQYTKNGIYLTFTSDDGVIVESKKSDSVETVPYSETYNNGRMEYKCFIDINLLMDQVKSFVGNVITIQYGNPVFIKFVNDSGIIQVTALLSTD